jgi:bla regulator protein blaR1
MAGQRGKENDTRIRMALRNLLADRFHLVTHNDTRAMTGSSLVAARNGFKLLKVEGSHGSWSMGGGKFTAKATSMEDFASFLAIQLDGPVVNATGIEGLFDMTLQYSQNDTPNTGLADTGPSIFTAI